MLNFILVLVFISSVMLFLAFLTKVSYSKSKVINRLHSIREMYNENILIDELGNIPLMDRIFTPFLKKIKSLIIRLTPQGAKNRFEEKLRSAGYPFGLNINGWLGVQAVCYFVIPAIFLVLLQLTTANPALKTIQFIIFTFVCIMLPEVILNSIIRNRRKRMTLQLPDVLDLLTVCVEAGSSFDGALAQVVEKSRGEYAIEFNRALTEMQMGLSRREALTNMEARCTVPDVTTFVSAILHAEQLGVSMGRILRVQAEQMRDKRKQRAREQAMKAPVKMLFPLVFFIFPTIFVVILGPAIIRIIQALF